MTGEILLEFIGHTSDVSSVAFNKSTNRIAIIESKIVHVLKSMKGLYRWTVYNEMTYIF